MPNSFKKSQAELQGKKLQESIIEQLPLKVAAAVGIPSFLCLFSLGRSHVLSSFYPKIPIIVKIQILL